MNSIAAAVNKPPKRMTMEELDAEIARLRPLATQHEAADILWHNLIAERYSKSRTKRTDNYFV